MSRIPPRLVNAYISGRTIRASNCLLRRTRTPQFCAVAPTASRRHLTSSRRLQELDTSTTATLPGVTIEPVPLRKAIKDELKLKKASKRSHPKKATAESLPDWELTIGIEIHAQLNTASKLFSSSPNDNGERPNTTLSFFDLALPGSQPEFQRATLIPALRAALALNCTINKESSWDRKHYFHWDQPSGYQITQFYRPFAQNGSVTLYPYDGIAAEDINKKKPGVTINIKQIQMEQDTAKTITQGSTHFLDFNRVGTPLIEIITGPDIHHPSTAAALVKKIQTVLNSVDACVLGMDQGGLRADVNVSVRRRGELGDAPEYNGVSGLGTRTEIKNLSSFKSIRDAIIVERDRQIAVLEAGGIIEGETRGYNIGDTFTTRLRGKEGEVDYRYMPDPDLAPLIIGEDLIEHLNTTKGISPDAQLAELTQDFGLSIKDALSLVSLDDGYRAEYFYAVVSALWSRASPSAPKDVEVPDETAFHAKWGPIAANWVLHELGGLTSRLGDDGEPMDAPLFDSRWRAGGCMVPPSQMAGVIWLLEEGRITRKTAKMALGAFYEEGVRMVEEYAAVPDGEKVEADEFWGEEGKYRSAEDWVEEQGLWYSPMREEEYEMLARELMEERLWDDILGPSKKRARGKTYYWLGKMMRERGEDCDAGEAGRTIDRLIEEERKRREGLVGEEKEAEKPEEKKEEENEGKEAEKEQKPKY